MANLTDEQIYVSITANAEAKWGEVMFLPQSEMEAALESAGMDADMSEMITDYEYEDMIREKS